jgi:hypothetical protein
MIADDYSFMTFPGKMPAQRPAPKMLTATKRSGARTSGVTHS